MATDVTLYVYEITGDTPTTHVWVEVNPEQIGGSGAGDTIHGLIVETGIDGFDHLIISAADLGASDFDIDVEELHGPGGTRTFMPIAKTNLGDSAAEGSIIAAILYTIDEVDYLVMPIITTA